jgi:hypothetical protein
MEINKKIQTREEFNTFDELYRYIEEVSPIIQRDKRHTKYLG